MWRLTAVRRSSLAMVRLRIGTACWFRWEGVWGAVPQALPDPSIPASPSSRLPEPAWQLVMLCTEQSKGKTGSGK